MEFDFLSFQIEIHNWLKSFLKEHLRLDKKAAAQFYSILGVVICKNHVARPLHVQEISFIKSGKFFLQKFEKCQNVIFGLM